VYYFVFSLNKQSQLHYSQTKAQMDAHLKRRSDYLQQFEKINHYSKAYLDLPFNAELEAVKSVIVRKLKDVQQDASLSFLSYQFLDNEPLLKKSWGKEGYSTLYEMSVKTQFSVKHELQLLRVFDALIDNHDVVEIRGCDVIRIEDKNLNSVVKQSLKISCLLSWFLLK
jgi:hypothetical protein